MRVILIVLDSVGIGELPDADEYGDLGSNTLLNIKKQIPQMDLKNLNRLGLSSIEGASALASVPKTEVIGSYGKMAELSKGKDTTVGHFELAGVITRTPFPIYPDGFPDFILDEFVEKTGREIIGNCVASGTSILETLGEEHVNSGKLIVYTSADSVFQIAAHEKIVPIKDLYNYCEIARKILIGENAVARVIARPFVGNFPNYKRTKNRKDYSILPHSKTMLEYIKESGKTVAAVGKIDDIFSGVGISQSSHTSGNMEGIDKTINLMNTVNEGLIFTNLVDFDMLYGHRNDVVGYAKALVEFDERLPEIINKMKSDDLLIITADHGCDPTTTSTDHSREYVPVLLYSTSMKKNSNLGVRKSFCDVCATILAYLGVKADLPGEVIKR